MSLRDLFKRSSTPPPIHGPEIAVVRKHEEHVMLREIETEEDAAKVRADLVALVGERPVVRAEQYIRRNEADPEVVERVVEESQRKRLERAARLAKRGK